MENSLTLMQKFTNNRNPYRTYVKGECLFGSEDYVLSFKQLEWLLNICYKELPKNSPLGWNPCFGTQREDDKFFYNLTTIGKRNKKVIIRKSIKQ